MESSQKLLRLLASGLLSKSNLDRTSRVFYDAAKIIYEQQKRSKKPQLKMRDISSAIVVADFFHSQSYRFEATGDLAGNFGSFNEAEALDYFRKRVMGTVQDKFGRAVRIDEDGSKSLYKEDRTGGHVVSPENYEEGRGKRLPWIRHTIQNSAAAYVSEETVAGTFRRTFLHTAIVSIPLKLQPQKPQVSYYVVIVREGKNAELRFVTAYSMFKLNEFLRIIARTEPYRRT